MQSSEGDTSPGTGGVGGVAGVQERVTGSNAAAARVRARLDDAAVPSLSVWAPPGAGRRTLLDRTCRALDGEVAITVLTGAGAVDTDGVEAALGTTDLDHTDLLVIDAGASIESPGITDLGEDEQIVLFPVTEGEDLPLRRPGAFTAARRVLMTKMDLLPDTGFDLHRAVCAVRDVNPRADVIFLSARSGEGMDEWLADLRKLAATRRFIPPRMR